MCIYIQPCYNQCLIFNFIRTKNTNAVSKKKKKDEDNVERIDSTQKKNENKIVLITYTK